VEGDFFKLPPYEKKKSFDWLVGWKQQPAFAPRTEATSGLHCGRFPPALADRSKIFGQSSTSISRESDRTPVRCFKNRGFFQNYLNPHFSCLAEMGFPRRGSFPGREKPGKWFGLWQKKAMRGPHLFPFFGLSLY